MDIIERHIRSACIDVYDEPHDPAARGALAALIDAGALPAGTAADALSIRTACTDLYDEPHNRATQLHVLALLRAHVPGAA